MLRLSAALAVVLGVFLTAKIIIGYSHALQVVSPEEHGYLTQKFVLQCIFALMSVGGGVLAIWRHWRSLLAASWGVILALAAPSLLQPGIPAAAARIMAARGSTASGVDIDPLVIVLVVTSVIGLVLCGLSEPDRVE
jgi:hypothetical protein